MQDTKSLQFKDNPYQYTRGIRFRIQPVVESERFSKKIQEIQSADSAGSDLSDLAENLLTFHKDLEELLFYQFVSARSENPDSCRKEKIQKKLKHDQYKQSKEDQKIGQPVLQEKKTNTSKADQEVKLNSRISVKKAWLREFHKDLFYLEVGKKQDGKYKARKYRLSELKSIGGELKERLKGWERYSLELKKASGQPRESRHSDIAEYIRSLSGRDQLTYMERFLEEISGSDPGSDEKINSLKSQLNSLKEKLKSAQEFYFSSQSSGVEVARASFNYYTVNKRPKNYYEEKPKEIEEKLKEIEEQLYGSHLKFQNLIEEKKQENSGEGSGFSIIKETTNETYCWKKTEQRNQENSGSYSGEKKDNSMDIFSFVSDQEKKWIKNYCKKHQQNDLEKDDVFLSLDETYRAMKAFKAEQKSIFYEIVTHIASKQNNSYENKNSNHLLKGWQFPYSQQNLKGMNTAFSLFQFTDKTIKSSRYTIDKILSSCKEGENQSQNNKVTSEKCYQKFVALTRQIQESGNKKNNNNRGTISDKSQNPKKDRGIFLFGSNCYFKEYGKFCETYKGIAQKRGRKKAQIKGLEKEKREAVQTDYWALIYCNQDKRQLWLVPKEKMQKAKIEIDNKNNEKGDSLGGSHYLCCFESLTMRALHKLCFSEQSEQSGGFVAKMPEELKHLQKESKKIKTDGDVGELEKKKQKQLNFFKKLMVSDYAKKKLCLENFNLKKAIEAENLETFEKELEKACYYIKKVNFPEKEKDDFIRIHNISVLDISSYDLEGRNKNTYQTPLSENRYHTDLWKLFWDNIDNSDKKNTKVKGFRVGEVRLNPEVKVYYRKADDNLKKYFKKRNFPSKFNHRKLNSQWTVHFTLSLNAGKKYEDLAFIKPEKLLEKIDDFNQKLNSQMDFKTVWKYGIDRGNNELATLCLVRFNPDKKLYKINNKTIVKPVFPKDDNASETTTCWTLKNSSYKEEHTTKKGETRTRWAINNLSYFVDEKYLNNRELFEEKNIACLDLTTAKVIKGKIITNGDVLTYLKLKKTVAKRQLYKLFQKGKITENASLTWSMQENGSPEEERYRPEGVLNIKTSNKEETIYHYCKRFEDILINKENNITYSQQSIKNSLNHYLNQLRQNNKEHTPKILKINHLRNAVTANMVGVICHLQKTYPGFVILEDLSKSDIDRHCKNEENISRRLENALYNKLQSLGLVPPHVKDIIQLREKQSKIKSQRQKERENDFKDLKRKQDRKKELGKNIESIKKGIKCARNSEKKEELKNKLKDKKEEKNGIEKEISKLKNKLSDEKNQNQSSQIGAIVFIPKEETSKSCPYCEENQQKQNEKDKTFGKRKNEEKFKQHRFICGERQPCGFDTYHFKKEEDRAENYTPEPDKQKYKEDFKWFEALDDPDKVAAYNIAKKITDPEKIGKMNQDS